MTSPTRIVAIAVAALLFSGCGMPLEHAFQQRSRMMLDEYFASWRDTTLPSIGNEQAFPDDTVRAIYDIYHVVTAAPDRYFDPSPAADVRYFLVQKELRYAILSQDSMIRPDGTSYVSDGLSIQVLRPFRPHTQRDGLNIIVMTDEKEETLKRFLRLDDPTARSPDDRHVRARFLSEYLWFDEESWADDGVFQSPPWINYVKLGPTLSKAFVSCGYIGGSGLELILEKQDGIWTVTSRLIVTSHY